MLDVDLDTIRLFLHVLAATVWVGGQLTLGGLVPALRRAGDDVPAAAARAFARIAWPAYGALVVTGVWNLAAIEVGDTTTEYQVTLGLKLLLVAASGIGAFLHARSETRLGLALGGAVGAVASLGALFLGVVLGAG